MAAVKLESLNIGSGSSLCGKRLKQKRKQEGYNKKEGVFYATAVVDVVSKPGSKNFISSRYVAYRKAMLQAKGKIVAFLETEIASKASSLIGNVPTPEQKSHTKILSPKKRMADADSSIRGISSRFIHLVNLKLKKELKNEGYDPEAKDETKRKNALKAAKKIVQTDRFKETLNAVAKSMLKGVFSKYSFENVPQNETATICVTAYFSPKSQQLADAMAARDFSRAPLSNKRKRPIIKQVPDPTEPNGLKRLLTSFGISIHVDENSDYNLVSYAQSGLSDTNNSTSRAKALGIATLRAKAQIRRFVNESVKLKEKSTTAENADDLTDNLRKVKFEESYYKALDEESPAFPINGLTSIHEWGVKHPITKQGIIGAVVVWNASSAEGAIQQKEIMNRKIDDTGGVNSLKKINRPRSTIESTDRKVRGTGGKSYQGGKTESDDDF